MGPISGDPHRPMGWGPNTNMSIYLQNPPRKMPTPMEKSLYHMVRINVKIKHYPNSGIHTRYAMTTLMYQEGVNMLLGDLHRRDFVD